MNYEDITDVVDDVDDSEPFDYGKVSVFESYETDPQKEVQGVWFTSTRGQRILLARAGGANRRYTQAMTKAMKPYMKSAMKGDIDTDLVTKLSIPIFASTVVRTWDADTMLDRNGNKIPFSREVCEEIFTKAAPLFDEVREFASAYDGYLRSLDEDAAKNL